MVKFGKALGVFIECAKDDPEAVAEQARMDFAIALESKRRECGISLPELAARTGIESARLDDVFRGDCDVTIAEMAKLALATGSILRPGLGGAGGLQSLPGPHSGQLDASGMLAMPEHLTRLTDLQRAGVGPYPPKR